MTFERFLHVVFKPCVYCGAEPSGAISCDDGTVLHVSTIDRIDPSRGYEACNVAPACLACNMGKGQMSSSEYFEHIQQVYKFQHLDTKGG